MCAEKESDDAAAGLAVRLGNLWDLLKSSRTLSDIGGVLADLFKSRRAPPAAGELPGKAVRSCREYTPSDCAQHQSRVAGLRRGRRRACRNSFRGRLVRKGRCR